MDSAEYLVAIITPMVKHPECIDVKVSQDLMGVLLSLSLHKEDMGIVIGKQGATAKSIRDLVRIAGFIHGARVNIRIEEPKLTT